MAELTDLSGNIIHDATTDVLMREHGIRRVLTRDMDLGHLDRFRRPIDRTEQL